MSKRFDPKQAAVILSFINNNGFMKFRKKGDARSVLKLGRQIGMDLKMASPPSGGHYVYIPGEAPWEKLSLQDSSEETTEAVET